MGLQSRLLAGLAVLVVVAIASTGWVTLSASRGRLEAAEEARARAIAASAAGLLGAVRAGPGSEDPEQIDRLRAAAESLRDVGGIRDVTLVDQGGRALVGDATGDASIPAALAGAGPIVRRAGGTLAVTTPIRAAGTPAGSIVLALRLTIDVGATLGEAVQGGARLLVALTLVDGGLILLFGALFLRGLVRPLTALAAASGRVAAGDLDVPPIPTGAGGEVGALADAFNKMTEALRKQKSTLAAQQEQLLAQEKLATVGRLAAGVAHEIGNPLTAVLGYVELLLSDTRDPAARDLLLRVQGETGRIHRIVHDLLDYARPVEETVEPVSIGAAAAPALDLLRPQPRFRAMTIENAIPADLPPAAASARRLLQVMLNLLLNAADATAGRGAIRLSGGTLRDNGNESVFVEIADDGPGVPASDRARIFDPFFTTKEPGAGTGLGLAVCRSIVGAFHGAIELRPSETGACFRVTLPRA